MRGKKGGEKMFSLWWFLVLAVVCVAIISGVLLYYSASIDVRGIESEILSSRIYDCFISKGNLNSNVFDKDFDLFKECRISESVINSKYYFRVKIFDSTNSIVKEFRKGVASYEADCEIQIEGKKTEAKNMVQCFKRIDNVVYSGESYKIEILAGSNNLGGRIK
jgi:hypothetical protein